MTTMDAPDRTPPTDIDAEHALISSIIVDCGRRLPDVLEIVREEHFDDASNAAVFGALEVLADLGLPIDAVTIQSRLQAQGCWDRIGGYEYFARMMKSTGGSQAVAAHQVYYAQRVRGEADRRRLIDTLTDGTEKAYTGEIQESIDYVLERLEPLLATTGHQSREVSWGDGIDDALNASTSPRP